MSNKFIAGMAGSLMAVGVSIVAFASPELIEPLVKHLSEAFQTQFARDCTIFSLAAAIHAGRMKKEIRANFEALTVSIDKVAAAFRDDLKSHSDKLDNLSQRVSSLESLQHKNQKGD